MATDNYNLLKEEITQQKEQIRSLYNRLEDEICSRKRLESIIRCNVLPNKLNSTRAKQNLIGDFEKTK